MFARFTTLFSLRHLTTFFKHNFCHLSKPFVRTFVFYPVLHVCDLKAGCKVAFINSYYDYFSATRVRYACTTHGCHSTVTVMDDTGNYRVYKCCRPNCNERDYSPAPTHLLRSKCEYLFVSTITRPRSPLTKCARDRYMSCTILTSLPSRFPWAVTALGLTVVSPRQQHRPLL